MYTIYLSLYTHIQLIKPFSGYSREWVYNDFIYPFSPFLFKFSKTKCFSVSYHLFYSLNITYVFILYSHVKKIQIQPRESKLHRWRSTEMSTSHQNRDVIFFSNKNCQCGKKKWRQLCSYFFLLFLFVFRLVRSKVCSPF